MRVVVVGASGNVGTSVLNAFDGHPGQTDVVAVARRVPTHQCTAHLRWVAADVTTDDLAPILDGADAVIHLTWAIQPSRGRDDHACDQRAGIAAVFDAAARAQVGQRTAKFGSAWLRKYVECVPGAIGWTPWGAFLQEHTEDHPMAHLREPGIEVWLEPQLSRDHRSFGSSSDLKEIFHVVEVRLEAIELGHVVTASLVAERQPIR